MDLSIITRVESHAADLQGLAKQLQLLEDKKGDVQQHQSAAIPPYEKKRKKKKKRDYEDLWACITRNMGKGFFIGYMGKTMINSLYPLMNLLRRRPVSFTRKAVLYGSSEYGLFLGSLLSIYNSLMFLSKRAQTMSNAILVKMIMHRCVRHESIKRGRTTGTASHGAKGLSVG